MPTEYLRAQCNGCNADIIWTTNEKGAMTPIDYEPAPNGTIALHMGWNNKPVSRIVTPKFRFGRKDLRTNHLVKCPDAARQRRRAGR